jgi:spore cortex formation protein SpoVR/YcgB (stage V sporulation)
MKSWQREIVRIVRKIGQYFYPQRQTQVMNEGWACFWHYTILNELYDRGHVTEGFMIEFLQSHTNVVAQPDFDSPYFNGINPYALGFNMMIDIRRICEKPTEEDKKWFPELAGTPWNESLTFAMRNFKDESFIAQYLSPKVIRDFKLFSLNDDAGLNELNITAIHNDVGYQEIRNSLSMQYNISTKEPNIEVYDVDIGGNRSLTLRHITASNINLDETTSEVMKHLHKLWGFPVKLISEDVNGEQYVLNQCPLEEATDING